MTRAASASAGSAAPSRPARRMGYFQRAEAPLTSLLFLLPLIILYELGTRYISATTHQGEQRIIAFNMLQEFFSLYGATGRYLPALAVVMILLAWHIARQDPWELRWGTIAGMFVESFLLAGPLILVDLGLSREMAWLSPFLPPSFGPGGCSCLWRLAFGGLRSIANWRINIRTGSMP